VAVSAALLLFAPAPATAQTPPEENAAPAEAPTTFSVAPRDRFDLVRFNNDSAAHYYYAYSNEAQTLSLLFLPPEPPALYAPLQLRNPLDTGVPPPAELAAHVTDPFYPQLAAALAADALPRRLRLKLDSYRSARAALVAELHDVFARHRDASAETRKSALLACAQKQAAGIQELELVADQLRGELHGASSGRQSSRLGTTAPPEPAPESEAIAMRSAAYFCDGLSAAQRRLLRATASESENSPSAAPASLFCFSPEGAKLALPIDLAPALRTAIADFTSTRRTLAKTILRTIRESGGDVHKIRELATAQMPALASLESWAEEFRFALETAPESVGRPDQALPPELQERLTTYREHKRTLFRELHASLLTKSATPATNTAKTGEVAVSVATFTSAQQAALAALNSEKNALRAALAEQRRTAGASADRKSIDTLLEDFERSRQQQELRELYLDYRRALFEPGLSPEQRRLLFGAAVQSLGLPLPSGELLRQP
jgi:hypothetical protein